MINEEVPDDGGYIVADTETYCEMRMATALLPSSVGHTLRYRLSMLGGNVQVSLKQGSTLIAQWSHAANPVTTFEQSLSVGQAGSITDYSDLRISFEVLP